MSCSSIGGNLVLSSGCDPLTNTAAHALWKKPDWQFFRQPKGRAPIWLKTPGRPHLSVQNGYISFLWKAVFHFCLDNCYWCYWKWGQIQSASPLLITIDNGAVQIFRLQLSAVLAAEERLCCVIVVSRRTAELQWSCSCKVMARRLQAAAAALQQRRNDNNVMASAAPREPAHCRACSLQQQRHFKLQIILTMSLWNMRVSFLLVVIDTHCIVDFTFFILYQYNVFRRDIRR